MRPALEMRRSGGSLTAGMGVRTALVQRTPNRLRLAIGVVAVVALVSAVGAIWISLDDHESVPSHVEEPLHLVEVALVTFVSGAILGVVGSALLARHSTRPIRCLLPGRPDETAVCRGAATPPVAGTIRFTVIRV